MPDVTAKTGTESILNKVNKNKLPDEFRLDIYSIMLQF